MNVDEFVIEDLEQFIALWSKTYNTEGKPDWSHILPYYDENIHFRDSVQEIRGFDEFRAMTERLTRRSSELEMNIVSAAMEDRTIFMAWEMTILFRKTRRSIVYGASRLTLNEEGKIIEQRDYYDLWGDIFDNFPGFGKIYRRFMKKVFG
ncbi:MAG: nuclear transport factor 2 family protein [Anaerolineae bacterium]